jgi:hypothetical protein
MGGAVRLWESRAYVRVFQMRSVPGRWLPSVGSSVSMEGSTKIFSNDTKASMRHHVQLSEA